jgi:hypothetical protein
VKAAWWWRAFAALALAALGVGLHANTSGVEQEEPLPPTGAALADPYYALRALAAATGSPFESRTTLEPLPPPHATLLLDSMTWSLFPERGPALKAWVEAGGHLVVIGPRAQHEDGLRWVPLAFTPPSRSHADDDDEDTEPPAQPEGGTERPPEPAATSRAPASLESLAASAPASFGFASAPRSPDAGASAAWLARARRAPCEMLRETTDARPAFEPGFEYLSCLSALSWVRPLGVAPTWGLAGARGPIALRVSVGRGEVTGTAVDLPIANRPHVAPGQKNPTSHDALAQDDNALIVAAILDLPSHRPVVVVGNEAREALPVWIWRHARAPLLFALAGIALALWRLTVRFGPRAAALARPRRSMGEQVRGTGAFIADREPAALHAATLAALDAAARARIEGWAGLDTMQRVDAIVALAAVERAAFAAALKLRPAAPATDWLAAAATLEQARRALLHARASQR